MAQFLLRRLTVSDAEAFRDLRLEGLRNHPEAFGSSFEEESERPLAWFTERLEENLVFAGCADDGHLLGVAALGIQKGLKQRHKAFLWGMYVRAEARGTGLAAALVARLLHEARGKVEETRFSVVTSNEAAIRLYRRHGFQDYGLEPRALKVADRY